MNYLVDLLVSLRGELSRFPQGRCIPLHLGHINHNDEVISSFRLGCSNHLGHRERIYFWGMGHLFLSFIMGL